MRLLVALFVYFFALGSAFSEESADQALKPLEVEINRSIEEFHTKKPKKHFFSSRRSPDFVVEYVKACLEKIESVGNLNYPDEARNKIYGNVIVYFEIEATGTIIKIEVARSSGQPILDAAAMKAVNLSSPLPQFPDEIRRLGEILVVVKTLHYVRAENPKD